MLEELRAKSYNRFWSGCGDCRVLCYRFCRRPEFRPKHHDSEMAKRNGWRKSYISRTLPKLYMLYAVHSIRRSPMAYAVDEKEVAYAVQDII